MAFSRVNLTSIFGRAVLCGGREGACPHAPRRPGTAALPFSFDLFATSGRDASTKRPRTRQGRRAHLRYFQPCLIAIQERMPKSGRGGRGRPPGGPFWEVRLLAAPSTCICGATGCRTPHSCGHIFSENALAIQERMPKSDRGGRALPNSSPVAGSEAPAGQRDTIRDFHRSRKGIQTRHGRVPAKYFVEKRHILPYDVLVSSMASSFGLFATSGRDASTKCPRTRHGRVPTYVLGKERQERA